MSEPRLYRDAREDMLLSAIRDILAELMQDSPRLSNVQDIAEQAMRTDDQLRARMGAEGCLLAPLDPARGSRRELGVPCHDCGAEDHGTGAARCPRREWGEH